MKNYFLLFVLLVSSTAIKAQQMYLEAGKTASVFDYQNSQGETLQNLQATSHSFMAMGYRGRLISTQKIKGSLGLRYAGYGAIGSDDPRAGASIVLIFSSMLCAAGKPLQERVAPNSSDMA